MDEEPLLRAMPRRPLYGLSGFITRIDLAVLDAIVSDGWCATRSAIRADIDCKEVRLACAVVAGSGAGARVLLFAADRFAATGDVDPEVEGLAGLRDAAKRLVGEASGGITRGVELTGYLNEEAHPDLRHCLMLVYRARVPDGTAAPAGMEWCARGSLPRSLEPLSARLQDVIT